MGGFNFVYNYSMYKMSPQQPSRECITLTLSSGLVVSSYNWLPLKSSLCSGMAIWVCFDETFEIILAILHKQQHSWFVEQIHTHSLRVSEIGVVSLCCVSDCSHVTLSPQWHKPCPPPRQGHREYVSRTSCVWCSAVCNVFLIEYDGT